MQLEIHIRISNYLKSAFAFQDQKENFIYFFNDDFSEPNCAAHEIEIERLRTYYETVSFDKTIF